LQPTITAAVSFAPRRFTRGPLVMPLVFILAIACEVGGELAYP
jgi:hypothetical protein